MPLCIEYFSTCTYCSNRFREQTKVVVFLLTLRLSKHFVYTRENDDRLLVDNNLNNEWKAFVLPPNLSAQLSDVRKLMTYISKFIS